MRNRWKVSRCLNTIFRSQCNKVYSSAVQSTEIPYLYKLSGVPHILAELLNLASNIILLLIWFLTFVWKVLSRALKGWVYLLLCVMYQNSHCNLWTLGKYGCSRTVNCSSFMIVLVTYSTVLGILSGLRTLKIQICTQDLYACSLDSSPAVVLPY